MVHGEGARALTIACEGCSTSKLVDLHPRTNRLSSGTRSIQQDHAAMLSKLVFVLRMSVKQLFGLFVRMRFL